MDLGFGKFRQFYIEDMIFRSLVTSFHAKSWDSVEAWQTTQTPDCGIFDTFST